MELKEDILNSIEKSKEFLQRESTQTKDMLLVFRDLLHKQLGGNKNPTDEEIEEAINQLKDVGKITALMPFLFLPESVLTIPLLVKLGKRYDIDILPK
ncbi:MAG: hypothetical protein U9O56_10085 [Campylobacterota bacterium]|nr:hypothetical protein [Campylobacterota bacterium]